jgi:uncharacterized protein YdeI (YjbR/CyaY-like superfamily)
MPARLQASTISIMQKASKQKSKRGEQHFEARLERLRSRLNWIVAYVPFDAVDVWQVRGQVRVRGDINGFEFRTSLFPTKAGRHFLLINKKMQKGARAVEGTVARFRIAMDKEERAAIVPPELERIFKQDRALSRWHDKLNYSGRNDISKWISEPKSVEARERRANQMAERLLSVMDAERELPPVLQLAFARHPQAREGWDRMSDSCRRAHLFGIFYYRTQESQVRRIDKMLDDATARAEKMKDRK